MLSCRRLRAYATEPPLNIHIHASHNVRHKLVPPYWHPNVDMEKTRIASSTPVCHKSMFGSFDGALLNNSVLYHGI